MIERVDPTSTFPFPRQQQAQFKVNLDLCFTLEGSVHKIYHFHNVYLWCLGLPTEQFESSEEFAILNVK